VRADDLVIGVFVPSTCSVPSANCIGKTARDFDENLRMADDLRARGKKFACLDALGEFAVRDVAIESTELSQAVVVGSAVGNHRLAAQERLKSASSRTENQRGVVVDAAIDQELSIEKRLGESDCEAVALETQTGEDTRQVDLDCGRDRLTAQFAQSCATSRVASLDALSTITTVTPGCMIFPRGLFVASPRSYETEAGN